MLNFSNLSKGSFKISSIFINKNQIMSSSINRLLMGNMWNEFRVFFCKKYHNFSRTSLLQLVLMRRRVQLKLKNHVVPLNYLKIGALPFLFSITPPLLTVHTAECSSEKQSHVHQEIRNLIQQGKLSLSSRENSNKAEMLYVRALHLAIKQDDHIAVAYVQDLLANLALQNDQLDKAEPLFRNILQNLISHGKPQNDPAVIEISLKLASIYARMGKKELALNGYQWTSNMCRNHIDEMEKKNIPSNDKGYINIKALHGMILDSYGRYLHDINDHKTALIVTLEALDISQELFGEKDARTLVLCNDLSSILMELGDHDQALTYVQKAITLSETHPTLVSPSEKAVFYTNLSYIYIKQGKGKEAETTYKLALLEAAKSDDKALQSHVASMVHVFSKDKK